jgi:hypothetical protein
MYWALFEEERSTEGHTASVCGGEFHLISNMPSGRDDLKCLIESMIPAKFQKHFQFYGSIFGATSKDSLTRTTSIVLGSHATNCETFKVDGVVFTRVYPEEQWNCEHNCCIALMPPSAGAMFLMRLDPLADLLGLHCACQTLLNFLVAAFSV